MQVNDHETLQLSIADASILELADMTTLTVTRTDTRGELTVDLRGDDASEATVVAVVRIPDGQATSLPVVVSGIDDFLLDGTQTVAFTATATGYEPGSATLDVADHESWQNPYNRLDVTFDGVVAPNDVLSIVNDINARGSRPLPPPTASAGPPSFLDVVLDGIVAPSDALAVINFFNSSSRTGGEAEASAGGLPAAQHVWPLELDDGQFERSRVAVAVETRPVLDVHRSNRPARLPTTTVWRHRLPAAADVAPSRHFEPLDIESSALDRIADLEEVLSGIAEDVSRRMNSARNQVKSEWGVSSEIRGVRESLQLLLVNSASAKNMTVKMPRTLSKTKIRSRVTQSCMSDPIEVNSYAGSLFPDREQRGCSTGAGGAAPR